MSGSDTTSSNEESSGNRRLPETTPDLVPSDSGPSSAEVTEEDIQTGSRSVQGEETEKDPGAFSQSETAPEPEQRKLWTDPLALPDTVQDAQGKPESVDRSSESTAADVFDVEKNSRMPDTNWEPIDKKVQARASQSPSPSSSAAPYARNKRFEVGDLFASKYQIQGHIGQGGMGVVYRAFDLVLSRQVAIKFLKAKGSINAKEMSRFQQEAKAIAALDHENIIRVHDMSVTADGDPYFVLEYLDGESLSGQLRREKTLPLNLAIDIATQICDALHHAHEHGIVHRDLKPSNLMVLKNTRGDYRVKLLDFGIAKRTAIDEETLLNLTKTGELFGSPHYMSPEQCAGQPIGQASDIYSLGCVLFEMLCGKPPFSGENAMITLDMHKNASLPTVEEKRPDLTAAAAVDDVLSCMLAKSPRDRFQSALEAKSALMEISRRFCPASEESASQSEPELGLAIGPQVKPDLKPDLPLEVHPAVEKTGGRKRMILLGLSLLAAGMLLSTVAVKLKWFGDSSSQAVPVADKTPWAAYDLKAQKLFDQGACERSKALFEKALARARTESGAKKVVHMNTSLRELRMVNHLLKDEKAIDAINEALLDLAVPKAELAVVDLNELDSKLKDSDGKTPKEVEKILDSMARVALGSNQDTDVGNLLRNWRSRARIAPGDKLAMEADVIEAFLNAKAGSDLSETQKRSIDTLIAGDPGILPFQISRALLLSEMNDLSLDKLLHIERFARYCVEHGRGETQSENIVLAKVLWLKGAKGEALQRLSQMLDDMEKQSSRDYALLCEVLMFSGNCHLETGEAVKAVPLLSRALAIAEIETQRSVESNMRDTILSLLGSAYLDLHRIQEAEEIFRKLVSSSLERYGANSEEYAQRLCKLGTFLCERKRFDEAESCLRAALNIFNSKQHLRYGFKQAQARAKTALQQLTERNADKPAD